MGTQLNEQHITTQDWVKETSFGKWFLSTNIWYRYVLTEAIVDLKRLMGARADGIGRLLDIGCGEGRAFPLLNEHLRPQEIVGIDIDNELLTSAKHDGESAAAAAIKWGSVTNLPLVDNSIDVVFCHQLIHHVAQQERALHELHRVLKPGGLLLLSESCKSFIETWVVRWFFRHPPQVQKTAEEYQQLVKTAGFEFTESDIQCTTPWWSLPDFGIRRRLGLIRKAPQTTEVLIVATKPLHN